MAAAHIPQAEPTPAERDTCAPYLTRELARSDVFDYIEMFYNQKRRHGASGGMAPVEYERQFRQSGVASLQKTLVGSHQILLIKP